VWHSAAINFERRVVTFVVLVDDGEEAIGNNRVCCACFQIEVRDVARPNGNAEPKRVLPTVIARSRCTLTRWLGHQWYETMLLDNFEFLGDAGKIEFDHYVRRAEGVCDFDRTLVRASAIGVGNRYSAFRKQVGALTRDAVDKG
jgi:hypothetical protein